MDTLPNELLRLIFASVLNSDIQGTHHLSEALRACKRWNKIGRAILWKAIRVSNKNAHGFLRSASAYPAHCVFVQGLTLCGNLLQASKKRRLRKKKMRSEVARSKHYLSEKSFQRLTTQISRLAHLNTVSIYNDDLSDSKCDEPDCFSYPRLRQLLDHLPSSVRSLEIDLRSDDDPDLEAQNCLCTAIGRLLPRLEHLRLRIPKLCPSLLVPAPDLRTCVINMSWMDMYTTCSCRQLQSGREFLCPDGLIPDDRITFIRTFTGMLNENADCFPAMKQFNLVSTYNFDEDWCGPSHLLLKDDFTNQQTTAFPMWCINEEAPPRDELWSIRIHETTDPTTRDMIGTSDEVESIAEASIWSQNVQSVRYVAERPPTPPLGNASSKTRSQYSGTCGVWSHEDKIGISVIAPQKVKLGETPVLNMDDYGECDHDYNNDMDSGCVNANDENDNNDRSDDDDDDDDDHDNVSDLLRP